MTKRYGFVYVDRQSGWIGDLTALGKNKALTGSQRSTEATVLIWIKLLNEMGTVCKQQAVLFFVGNAFLPSALYEQALLVHACYAENVVKTQKKGGSKCQPSTI